MKCASHAKPYEWNSSESELCQGGIRSIIQQTFCGEIDEYISPSMVDHCINPLLMKIKVPLHFPYEMGRSLVRPPSIMQLILPTKP